MAIGLFLSLMAVLGNFIVCAQPSAGGLPPVRDGDGRFGLCFIEPEEPWLSLAYDAGARVNRWQINWRDIEHEEGNFYYGWYDPQIRAMREKGFEISAILTYPPDWATEKGSVVPRNLYLPYDDPANYWGRFVRKVVERYRGQIASWEIWNEPDLEIYWDGTAKDYYQLLKVAYQAAKAADPTCRVAMGGMSHWEDPRFFERVVRLAVHDPEAPAHNYFFDAVAWHWYSRPSLLYDKALWCRQVLAKYGLTKPIWVNETNVPLWGEWPGPETRQPDHATLDEQASASASDPPEGLSLLVQALPNPSTRHLPGDLPEVPVANPPLAQPLDPLHHADGYGVVVHLVHHHLLDDDDVLGPPPVGSEVHSVAHDRGVEHPGRYRSLLPPLACVQPVHGNYVPRLKLIQPNLTSCSAHCSSCFRKMEMFINVCGK